MGIALDRRIESFTAGAARVKAQLRILIADEHEVVRLGVRALVEAHPGWSVCAEASDGWDVVEKAKQTAPDVVILDTMLPGLNAVDVTRRIRAAAPRTEVIALTSDGSERRAGEVLAAGARGYLMKSDAMGDIVKAVEAVARHKRFITPRVAARVPEEAFPTSASRMRSSEAGALSSREREVLQLLAEGRTAKEVAGILRISKKTVDAHRANIGRKLNLRSLCDLIRYAIRNGLAQV